MHVADLRLLADDACAWCSPPTIIPLRADEDGTPRLADDDDGTPRLADDGRHVLLAADDGRCRPRVPPPRPR